MHTPDLCQFRRRISFAAFLTLGVLAFAPQNSFAQAGADPFAHALPRLLATLQTSGKAAENVVQGQDISSDGFIYGVQVKKASGDAWIKKLDLHGNQVADIAVPGALVHQTLFLEDKGRDRFIWLGGSDQSNNSVVRVRESDHAIQRFPINFSLSRPGTYGGNLSIAYDRVSGLMAVANTLEDTKERWVFVYRLADIEANGSSAKALNAFAVPFPEKEKGKPLQGIAIGDGLVWVRIGNTKISKHKALVTFTLNGQVVNSRQISPGLDDARDEGKKLESESVSLFRDADGTRYMAMEMEGGRKGHDIHQLYILREDGGHDGRSPLSVAYAAASSAQ